MDAGALYHSTIRSPANGPPPRPSAREELPGSSLPRFPGQPLLKPLGQRSGIIAAGVAVLERRAAAEPGDHVARRWVRRKQDVAVERRDSLDARSKRGERGGMIGEAVIV